MKDLNFVAFDVETANADPASICQLGIAVFKDGEVVETWESLVNPQTHFDAMNVFIHGIEPEQVKNAPTLRALESKLHSFFDGNIVATYSSFDKVALAKNGFGENYDWLDITRVVRRTWEEVAYSGYGLANVCAINNIKIEKHHDAVSDAISAGKILALALSQQKINMVDCKKLISKRIGTLLSKGKMLDTPEGANRIIDGGNPEGEWYGEVLCFTGQLSIPRVQASIVASQAGFHVADGVTKKTTFLVKGYQDQSVLNGKAVSSKEEKALKLIKKGQDMFVINEADFFDYIKAE